MSPLLVSGQVGGASRARGGSRRFARAIALGAALLLLAVVPRAAMASGTLTVGITGKGDVTQGTVINCNESGGPDCSQFYADLQGDCIDFDGETRRCVAYEAVTPTPTLTAGPDRNGYRFRDWLGCDAPSGRDCQMTMDGDKAVSARFDDVTPPAVSGLWPSSGYHRGVITVSANASDNSGVVRAVQLNVGSFRVADDETAPYSGTFDTAATRPDGTRYLPDGPVQVTAIAVDRTGYSSSQSGWITVDNTQPTLSFTAGPNGGSFGPGSTQTWTFTPSDATSTVASVACSVVPTGAAPSFAACSGGNGSHSVTGKPEGSYTLSVRVRDGAGNEIVTTRNFTIDATPPQTTIDSGPGDGSSSTDTSAAFTFSSGETGSTFRCRVYPAALTPPAFADCTEAARHVASGFSPGIYAFEVIAVDAAGNADPTPAKRTFTVLEPSVIVNPKPVDTAPPVLTLSVARQKLGTVILKGLKAKVGSDEGAAFTARLTIAGSPAKKLGLTKTAKTTVIGTGKLTRTTAGTGTVTVKLTSRAKKALRATRSLRTTLGVTGADALGNRSAEKRKTLTLKR